MIDTDILIYPRQAKWLAAVLPREPTITPAGLACGIREKEETETASARSRIILHLDGLARIDFGADEKRTWNLFL